MNDKIKTMEMNHFCTLFDSLYLTRGLALYRSLINTSDPFILYVYCFDDECYESLFYLKLPNILPIRLCDFETEELLRVKPSRTQGEYCWTGTPHVLRDALNRFHLEEVTYLDADIYFFNSPSILLSEFRQSGASVLLTEHRWSPRQNGTELYGVYCVQFMTFRSDANGMKVLNWWADRCIEWCFNRVEDGKFGDQKYLDNWSTQFESIYVVQNIGGGVAPWNIQQYRVTEGPKVDGIPVIFYHFHRFKIYESGRFSLCDGPYRLGEGAVKFIYLEYVAELKECLSILESTRPNAKRGTVAEPGGVKAFLQKIKRKVKGMNYVVQ